MAPRDWRNAADYEDLGDLDLPGFAWEFLRRSPAYRRAFEASALGARPLAPSWGLRFAVDPDLEAPRAQPFWRAEIAPAHVVALTASPGGGAVAARLTALGVAQRLAVDGLHLRFDGGLQALIPPELAPDRALATACALDAQLLVRLAAAGALARRLSGLPPQRSSLPALRRRRLVQMVQALDARAAGAAYRDVAERVLGRVVEAAAWRTSPTRDVAIRLCRAARRMMGGGYRALLFRRP